MTVYNNIISIQSSTKQLLILYWNAYRSHCHDTVIMVTIKTLWFFARRLNFDHKCWTIHVHGFQVLFLSSWINIKKIINLENRNHWFTIYPFPVNFMTTSWATWKMYEFFIFYFFSVKTFQLFKAHQDQMCYDNQLYVL